MTPPQCVIDLMSVGVPCSPVRLEEQEWTGYYIGENPVDIYIYRMDNDSWKYGTVIGFSRYPIVGTAEEVVRIACQKWQSIGMPDLPRYWADLFVKYGLVKEKITYVIIKEKK